MTATERRTGVDDQQGNASGTIGGVLRRPPVVALVAAEVISATGSQMTALALPWFVLTTTGSPSRMALVVAAEELPWALLGIPAGTAAARLGLRRTLVICNL